MSKIFLIRHGEPEAAWGESDDPGLTSRGRAQAQAVAESLAAHGALALVSSPMRRCRETAAVLVEKVGAALTIEPRVSEVLTPPGLDDRRAWLMRTFPWAPNAAGTRWSALDPALRTWRDDAIAAVRELRGDCAVFTHFIAINAIVSAVLERDETIVCRPDLASITTLESEGGRVRLVSHGDQMVAGGVR